jgi:S1-C subfamily serine protease
MEKLKIFIAFAIAASIILLGASSKQTKFQIDTADSSIEHFETAELAKSKDHKVFDSVVQIEIYQELFGSLRMLGSATAFSVDYDKKENASYLLTNHHVCEDALTDESFLLTYLKTTDPIPDFEIHTERALEVISADPSNDLCLVKASNERLEPVKFRSSSTLDTLENIYSIGGPGGIFPIWIHGKYSGPIDRDNFSMGMGIEGRDFILLSATIIGGQSGSPVYDEKGRVVGIIFATLGQYGGIATPSDTIVEFLKPLL